MRRTRGRELPGMFNPMLVADLFVEQSKPWEEITRSYILLIWKATKDFLRLTVASISDSTTSNALFQKIFEPALDELWGVLGAKTSEMLKPHQDGHPITYNHYFTETLQAVRNGRRRAKYSQVLRDFFGADSLKPTVFNRSINLDQLLINLTQDTEPDMKRFACSEALDCMQAYYKV